MADHVVCPWCGFHDKSEYKVQLHIEERHTDNSPFVPEVRPPKINEAAITASRNSSDASKHESMPGDMWTRCTRPGCGEYVLLSDADEHLDLHIATALSESEHELPPPLPPRRRSRSPSHPSISSNMSRRPDQGSPRKLPKPILKNKHDSGIGSSFLRYFTSTSDPDRSVISSVRRIREPRNPGRLGKRELGPYAFEDRMPSAVREDLLEGAEPIHVQRIGADGRLIRTSSVPNETPSLIPILADLCALEEDTAATYLCHPSVRHITKLRCDGNFCGYWNIQVLLSYIQHVNPDGPQRIPNVLEIQNLIEQAWDREICAYSRIETGGIRNTRKWIGTQEALAFFTRINVKVEALTVEDGEEGSNKRAVEDLLDYVEAYFISGVDAAQVYGTSHRTQLAPIYFQRLGHSMTIVGLERRKDGSRNLLVFDSSFATSEPMKKLLSGRRSHTSIANLLKPYRRSDASLSRWDEFEMIIPASKG